LRLAFFGTPDFAVPTLARLLEGPHSVVAVVSQPDRPRGRGRKQSLSPVSTLALQRNLPLLRPEKVGTPAVAEELREFAPDLGVVVAFGQFLPKRIRELPALGYLVNGHASLLPRHRGAAPVAHAILAGDPKSGVSVMRVEREMDAGPVALVRELAVGDGESAGELATRLSALSADAIAEVLERIVESTVVWSTQDDSLASFAPKIERADAELDFHEPAEALVRRVRAMAPRPGAFAWHQGDALRILAARAEPGPAAGPPGRVSAGPAGLRIATAEGWLVPTVLQRAGGRPTEADAFQRGRGLPNGVRLEARLGRAARSRLEA
jgi:methionyl-tRNA formyltransferase